MYNMFITDSQLGFLLINKRHFTGSHVTS